MNSVAIPLSITSLLIIIGFYIGKRIGIRETNMQIVSAGTWIEIISRIKLEKGLGCKENIIRAGTQAIVTNITAENEILIWIAKPWQSLYKDELPFYRIKNYSKIKIIAQSNISYDVFTDTLNAIEKENDRILFDYFSHFPEKWFTWQNDLNSK